MDTKEHFLYQLMDKIALIFTGPVEYFRENIVVPYQKKYPWYHQNFQRVPTIAECGEQDVICRLEAQFQFERDKLVDDEILAIIRQRYEDCCWYYENDRATYCTDLYKAYEDTAAVWFMKYGDIPFPLDVVDAFMKQKHRMIWERRHGPVGSGITNKKYAV